MKGKRYTTEEKIRILRQADGGGPILEVCRQANISEVTFYATAVTSFTILPVLCREH